MLGRILSYLSLPLLLLLSNSSGNSAPQPPTKNQDGPSGTLQKMFVESGRVTMDLDFSRLEASGSARQDSTPESVRFEVNPNSFFTILVFNDALRALEPGAMGLIGGTSTTLRAPLGASSNQLVIERTASGEDYELVVRDGKTGFGFFGIQGHEIEYDANEHLLTLNDGRLLVTKELATQLGLPAEAGSVIGKVSIAATMRAIEISQVSNGEVSSMVMPAVGTRPGPDVIVGDLSGLAQFDGSSGTQVGLAVGTDSCNAGVEDLNWFANPNNDHPVIPQNLYRMSGGGTNNERFEQIGQSSVKHAFTALTNNLCGFGCNGVGGTHLGSGCSDPYSASLNSGQSGHSLGSRAWINPFTGFFPRNDSATPNNSHTGHTHTGPSHRVLVEINDLNTTLNPGATYYAEGQYVTPHEYAWCQTHAGQCNMNNNVSYRRYNVTGTGSPFTFQTVAGQSTVREAAAIRAWTGATINQIEPAPGVDGIGLLGYKVTNPSAGVWHYEYAVYNQNLDRAFQSFSVPLGPGVTVSNISFHAPPQHPGWAADGTVGNAGYSSTPWTPVQTASSLSWSSETFAQNQNANAIRWGTLYNFRFDSNRPPQTTNATVGFFKTGTPITVGIQGPSPDGSVTPTPTPTPPTTPTPTPTATATATATATPTATATATATPTATATATATSTPTATATATPTATATATLAPTPTPTATVAPSATPSATPCIGTVLSESFDHWTPPLLPPGWVPTNAAGPAPLWVTSSATPDTPPNHLFIDDPATLSDKILTLPNIAISTVSARVTFRNNFDLQDARDGGVLEVSSPNINAGAFTDITNAAVGGSFVTGGYTDTISTGFGSPIAGRMAWSGLSGGYITTVANLGPNVAGQTIKLRFRMASDNSVSGVGWRVDTILVVDGACPSPTPTVPPTATPSPSSPGSPTPPPTTPAPTATATATPTATIGPSPTPFGEVDIALTMSDSPDPVQAGNNLTYTIIVANLSGRPASNVQMSDELPPGVNFVSVATSQGSCTGTTAIHCNLGVLSGVQDSATVTLVVTPTTAGTLTNTATCTTTTPQVNLGNNTDTEPTTVNPASTATPTPTATPTATATIAPTATPTPTITPTPPPPAAQSLNLSTRMRVQTGDGVGIGGFIITGSAPKHILLRAIGPSLAQSGIPNVLADPVMELHGQSGFATVTNDNWRDDPVQEAAIIATGIPPSNNLESAIDATLLPGAYTAIVRGQNNTSGVALVEVYDLSPAVPAKLANISTRAFVSTGSDIVIAGFILGGNSGEDQVVIRGLGATGVSNPLVDPTLELRDADGALIGSDNDWQDDPAQAAALSAVGLAPPNTLDAAIMATLPPGLYTALLAGRNNGTGIGLVEVYDLGAP